MPHVMAPKKKNAKLSSAEKQRQYRARIAADPEKKEKAKEKERQRWHARRQQKKVKYIADMTKREARCTRKQWRQAYHNKKARQEEVAVLLTSPQHALPQPQHEPDPQPEPQPGTSGNPTSSQKKRGRKKVRKDRSACYKKNKNLTKKLEMEKGKNELLRKRLSRAKLKIKIPVGQKRKCVDTADTASPRKRARLTMNSGQDSIRRELIFHYALTQQIKQGKQTSGINSKRAQLFSKLFGLGNVLSKYRLLTKAQNVGLLSKKLLKTNAKHRNENVLVYERAKKSNSVTEAIKETITQFFERDDVSWCAPGVRQVITREKVKKQKRFLLDTVKGMYKKYVQLHPVKPVSHSTFRKLKPFWVVKPRVSDRETCLCKVHENISLLHDKLKSLGYLAEKSAEAMITTIVCSIDSKECMYRNCADCKNALVVFRQPAATCTGQPDESQTLWWWQWKSADHSYKDKDGQVKTTKKTVKCKVEGTVAEMKQEYNTHIQKFSTHVFNIHNQFQVCREKKSHLGEDEALLHVDFAENWTMKSLRQIQSAHYGASNSQITLHTGVAYIGGVAASTTVPFCSLSDNNNHSPSTIWCHLIPILLFLTDNHPTISKLHFMSDGPVTQYRGRHNLHLLSNIPFQMGFKEVWWNFSEAGHGKGACDGVGATIKRLADDATMTGTEICDAQSMLKVLEEKTNIKLYLVPGDAEISQLPAVPAVKGVMKVHQVYSQRPGIIDTRDISCYCGPENCNCYSPSTHEVLQSNYHKYISVNLGQVFKQQGDIEVAKVIQEPNPDVQQDIQDVQVVQQPNPDVQQEEAQVMKQHDMRGDIHDINMNKSDAEPDSSCIQTGCYALVQCGEKYYPGMLMSVDRDNFEVKYLKQTGSYHEWMSGSSSSSWQPREDLVERLQVPDMDRRGHVIFSKKDLQTIKKYTK